MQLQYKDMNEKKSVIKSSFQTFDVLAKLGFHLHRLETKTTAYI